MNFIIIQGRVINEGKYSFIYYRKNINNRVLTRKPNKIISIKKYKKQIINEYREKENKKRKKEIGINKEKNKLKDILRIERKEKRKNKRIMIKESQEKENKKRIELQNKITNKEKLNTKEIQLKELMSKRHFSYKEAKIIQENYLNRRKKNIENFSQYEFIVEIDDTRGITSKKQNDKTIINVIAYDKKADYLYRTSILNKTITIVGEMINDLENDRVSFIRVKEFYLTE